MALGERRRREVGSVDREIGRRDLSLGADVDVTRANVDFDPRSDQSTIRDPECRPCSAREDAT